MTAAHLGTGRLFLLSQDVSLRWHCSSGWQGVSTGIQALVAASLKTTLGLVMPSKQIFQVLNPVNVSV